MSIVNIIFSPAMAELLELRNRNLPRNLLELNWFSAQATSKIYSDFLKLDADKNGMLSRKEMTRFNGGHLTRTFLDRLFDSVQLFNGEMVFNFNQDYLVFLDLVLALENQETTEGISWLFKIIDVKKDGFLDQSTVAFFVKDVCTRMFVAGMEPISRSDMLVF